MKVVLDYRMFSWSGIGRYSQGLALALARRDDLELSLICELGATLPNELAQLPRFEATAHPLNAKGFRELLFAVRDLDADLLHCVHISTPRPKAKVPIVTTLHDLTPLLVGGVMPSIFKRAAYSALNSRAVSDSSAIITPSQHTAADVAKFFPKSAGKITTIPLAADELLSIKPTRPKAVDCLSQSVTDLAAPFILSMGNIKEHKNLSTLFAAFKEVARSQSNINLLLVGKEPTGYLHKQIEPDLLDRVQFTGSVTDAELVWLYSNAQVFVFPSLYEGFGLPPLEAMSFGCPTVVSDAASLPEVVGDAGIKCAPLDSAGFVTAIRQVLTDATFAQDLRERGLVKAQQFAWKKTAEATAAVYHNACKL